MREGILKKKLRKKKTEKIRRGKKLFIFFPFKSGRREKISQKLKKENVGAPKIGAIPR